MAIRSRADLDAYLDHDRIECLECGERFAFLPPHLKRAHGMSADEYREKHGLPTTAPLAGRQYRAAHREKIRTMQSMGQINYDHLDAATEAARTAGRGTKTDYDRQEQVERITRTKPWEKNQLPPGSKRADGRDADKARDYQRSQRRANSSTLEDESHGPDSIERQREWAHAQRETQKGNPWPKLRYLVKYGKLGWFTEDEDEIVRTFYPVWGAKRVAAILHRDHTSIYKRARVLGVKSADGRARSNTFQWNHERHDNILRNMVDAGASQLEIARTIGTSPATVKAHAERLGVNLTGRPGRPRKHPHWPPSNDRKLAKLAKMSMPVTKIAEAMKVSIPTVRAHAARLGVEIRRPGKPQTGTQQEEK